MSRTRIVGGIYTKITGGDYKMYTKGDTIITAAGKNDFANTEKVIIGINPENPPMIKSPFPVFNGHIIFCNGYLSDPIKNFGSYLNVFLDKNPDNKIEKPFLGKNMDEEKLTNQDDILTNTELDLMNRQGADYLYNKKEAFAEKLRWLLFASKENFEGYWDNYDSSEEKFSKVFERYFNANGNRHFINGSHGLQSSAGHRVEHGIAQGYVWAKNNWDIRSKKEVEDSIKNNKGAYSYSPQYKPITIVGHSQGAAIAAGVAIGVIYYAYELGWDKVAINLIFLGTHQPQGLYGEAYENFKKYYFEDYINDWIIEWASGIFKEKKVYKEQGIQEKMAELLGDINWKGLKKRAIQFTFPNDRALFVTRMGDIPGVRNACNIKDNTYVGSWQYNSQTIDKEIFIYEDKYAFPKRILNKSFNKDGTINYEAPTFKDVVKEYWDSCQKYYKYKKNPHNNEKYDLNNSFSILKKYFPQEYCNKIYEILNKEYSDKKLLELKLKALLNYMKLHEMELQAHFAPVGLMFNKGVLSEWEETYKDQTIWDRIKDIGKDIFYKVSYSDNIKKHESELSFVNTEGKERMISSDIVNTPSVKKWIDKAKEEIMQKDFFVYINKWWNGDKTYRGSGWGHGLRQSITNFIGLKEADKIESLIGAGFHSILQNGEVEIGDRIINKIEKDPAFINIRNILLKKIPIIKQDPRYLKEDFQWKNYSYSIQLGGKRSTHKWMDFFLDPMNPNYIDTWKVAMRELTWLLRSITLKVQVSVKKDGNIIVNYSFSDIFDLRASPKNRSDAYNTICMITGFLYHDLVGGNDLLKINGKWSRVIYNPKLIEIMKRIKEKQDSDNRKLMEIDEYNRMVPLLELF